MEFIVTLKGVSRENIGDVIYEAAPIKAGSAREAIQKAQHLAKKRSGDRYWYVTSVNGETIPVFGTHRKSHRDYRMRMNRASRRAFRQNLRPHLIDEDWDWLDDADLRKLGKRYAGGYVYRTASGKQGID